MMLKREKASLNADRFFFFKQGRLSVSLTCADHASGQKSPEELFFFLFSYLYSIA